MAQFRIDADSDSVVVDLVYHVISANAWTQLSGASSILGVIDGTWTFASGPAQRLKIQDSQGSDLAYLDGVKYGGFIDVLSNVSVGDSGMGDLVRVGGPPGIQWTVVAK